jgi:hypothetical protein
VILRISFVVFVLVAMLLAPGLARRSGDRSECGIQIASVRQFPGVASAEHPVCEWAFVRTTGSPSD